MNLKPAYRYQLSLYVTPTIIYYAVVFILTAFLGVSFFSVGSQTTRQMSGGLDGATAVFLFFTSLFTFRETYLMLTQNGVSRKSLFLSRMLVTGSVALSMALIDRMIFLLETLIWSAKGISFYSVYDQIYGVPAAQYGALMHQANVFLFDLFLNLTLIAAGYIITVLFYRLNKAGKVAVGVGAPLLLFFIYPLVDQTVFHGGISHAVGSFFTSIFGISPANPHIALLSLFVIFAALTAVTWLLARKAVVKI